MKNIKNKKKWQILTLMVFGKNIVQITVKNYS